MHNVCHTEHQELTEEIKREEVRHREKKKKHEKPCPEHHDDNRCNRQESVELWPEPDISERVGGNRLSRSRG